MGTFSILNSKSEENLQKYYTQNENGSNFKKWDGAKSSNGSYRKCTLAILFSIISCMGQLNPIQTDHMQEDPHLRVKATEYDVYLVWSMLSDLKKAKGYTQSQLGIKAEVCEE